MDQAHTHARAIRHDRGEVLHLFTAAVETSECGQLVKRAQLGPQGVSEAKVGKAAALFLADYDKRAAAAAHAERAAAE